jgi:hypothetical protein
VTPEKALQQPLQTKRTDTDAEAQEGPVEQSRTATSVRPSEPIGEAAASPPPVQPPPQGTVVIAVGETLLAGEAETVVEEVLSRAGIELVDEHGIPGLARFLGTDLAPEPGEIRQLLRPYAANLVLVRVEYLGERPLMYMGQRDVAFQSRVIVVPVDLQTGSTIAQPVRLRTEYTHLNAQRVAEKELRRPAYHIAQVLAAR